MKMTNTIISKLYLKLIAIFTGSILLIFMLGTVKDIVSPYLASFVLAFLLYPLCLKFERMNIPYGLSVSIVVFFLVLFFIMLNAIIFPLFIKELNTFVGKLPDILKYIEDLLIRLNHMGIFLLKEEDGITSIKSYISTIDAEQIRKFIVENKIFNKITNVGQGLLYLVFIPVIVYFLLRDWKSFCKLVYSLFPNRTKPFAISLVNNIKELEYRYLKGQLTVMVCLGLYYCIILSIIGIDSAILIGVMTGVIVFIPYVGAMIGFILCSLIAVVQFGDPYMFLWVGLIYGFGQTVESIYLTPRLVGESIGVHPVLIMFALTVGSLSLGIVGLLIAMPVLSALVGLTRFVYKDYINSGYYKSQG